MSEYDGSMHSLNGNENIRIFYEKNSRMKFYFGNENQMLEVIFVNALQKLYISTHWPVWQLLVFWKYLHENYLSVLKSVSQIVILPRMCATEAVMSLCSFNT